jgi:hypothetical protein
VAATPTLQAASPTPSPVQQESPTPAPAKPEPRFEWTEDSGTRVSDGSVPYIQKLKDGRYRLYYCGPGGILSALSTDGLAFEKEGGVRLAPVPGAGNPESIVCDATLVDLPGGRVRMYYKGSNGPGGPGQALHKVFSATSPDGLSFQREGLRIDSEQTGDRGWASVPEAFVLPDGRVRLYYVSGDFEAQGGIMSALSSDGLSFTKEAGARAKGLVDPAVTRLPDGRYLMLAAVLPAPPNAPQELRRPEGLYYALSDDGLAFGEPQPVLQERGVYDPTMIKIDEKTFRVYYGKDLSTQAGRPNIVTVSLTGRLR